MNIQLANERKVELENLISSYKKSMEQGLTHQENFRKMMYAIEDFENELKEIEVGEWEA